MTTAATFDQDLKKFYADNVVIEYVTDAQDFSDTSIVEMSDDELIADVEVFWDACSHHNHENNYLHNTFTPEAKEWVATNKAAFVKSIRDYYNERNLGSDDSTP